MKGYRRHHGCRFSSTAAACVAVDTIFCPSAARIPRWTPEFRFWPCLVGKGSLSGKRASHVAVPRLSSRLR